MFEATITLSGLRRSRSVLSAADQTRVVSGADDCAAAAQRPRRAAASPTAPARRRGEDRGTASGRHCSRDGNLLAVARQCSSRLGLGLAFTPCVLPMVPILSSIIVGQGGSVTRVRAFTLSLAYVLGMAVTYAALGVLVGLFGASMNLQAALQSPPVLIVLCARLRAARDVDVRLLRTATAVRRGRTASMRCRRTSAAACTSAS